MANVTITQLPQAAPITGSELVPVVQNGVTVQTTTGAIAAAPAQSQTFLTLNQETTLPNSRYLSVGTGLGLADGGAQSTYQIALTGAGLSLLTSPNGLQVKTGPNTVGAVQIAVGAGLGITNPDGITGNPTISLAAGIMSNLAATTGTGFLAVNGATVTPVSLQPVANQTVVYDAAAAAGVPAVGLADNPVVPGTASITVPTGTTAQRVAVPTAAMFRFNTTTGYFEGYDGATWRPFSVGGATLLSFSAGATGLTPNTASTGAVTLGGVLNAASGGTGAASLTGYIYGNGASPATASTTIPTTALSGQITSAQLADTTGTGGIVLANSPTLVTPALGTPSSATLTNATGLPVSTGISGLGTGVAAALGLNTNTTSGFVTQSGADGRYAALAGLSTQVFSVAASTSGTAQAVPRSQADTLYAPISGSTVYTSSAALAASGGATLVGYTQGASGSVLRTQASKNQESVSVQDFGADPTGATDSAPAFRLTLASNRRVIVPPGTYLFKSTQTAPPSNFDPACVLAQGLSNFSLEMYGATITVDSSVALSSAFQFDQCSDFVVRGGKVEGNRTGLTSGQENVAITLSSCVNFWVCGMRIAGNFGGDGAGIAGDWLVDGAFDDIRMDAVGIAADVAFLKNISFSNVRAYGADTNGASGSGSIGTKGFSIIYDGPNAANNNTGISFTQTDNVNFIGCYATNFATGTAISTGQNITFVGGAFEGNPGSSTVQGFGAYIYYTNGGSFSSVGYPAQKISFLGVKFESNGNATVGGAGLFFDATASTNGDQIKDIAMTGCVFNNNNAQGIGCQGTANLANLSGIGNTFDGVSQTYSVAPNLVPLFDFIQTDQASFGTGVSFQQSLYVANNQSVYFKDSSGVSRPAIIGTSLNTLVLRPLSAAAYMDFQDYAGVSRLQIAGAGGLINFANATTATTATAGAASALPSVPVGYLEFQVDGGTYKLPYYAV
ncbi:MAG: hypothetical protein WC829_01485 [Hyphomicrobium sp.]|jgi:hypothetical protein